MDGTPWRFLRKLLKGCASVTGGTLLMVVVMFFIATTDCIPSILSAAAASARTADPTPTNPIPAWDNNPQRFASAVRDSIGEIYGILASYSRYTLNTTPFPTVVVANGPTKTGCALESADALFEPSQKLFDFCLNGRTVFYSEPWVRAYVAKLGPGAFAALLVKSLFSRKASNGLADSRAVDGRAACMSGAWFGYATYWEILDGSLTGPIQQDLTQEYPAWFETGRAARSLNPCLAV